MRILKIVVSGFRKLENNFCIDFIGDSTPRKAKKDNELAKIFCDTYAPLCYTIIGNNGHGKTSVLSLILLCYELLNNRRVRYNRLDFAKDKIDLEIFVAEYEYMYNYRCTLYPPEEVVYGHSFCRIERKWLAYKRVKKHHSKTFYKGKFYPVKENGEISRKNTPVYCVMQQSTREILLSIIKMYKEINYDVFIRIFQLFEPHIDHVKLSEDENHFYIKSNGHINKLSISEMIEIISFGTLKGVLLYMTAYFALKHSAILIIDEIDASIKIQILINLLKLFIDKKTNPYNSTIYLSTYNDAILDLFRRNDSIFVVNKTKQNNVTIKSLTEHYHKRIRGYKSKFIENYEFTNNCAPKLTSEFIYYLHYK